LSPRLNKSHLIISILAAVVILAGFVAQTLIGDASYPFRVAMWVSIAIVVFYFIGTIIRYYLISQVFMIDLEPVEIDVEEQPEGETLETFDETGDIQEEMMFEAPIGGDEDPFPEPEFSNDEI